MNRAANILLQLESMLSVTPAALALRFGVGARTIGADVAHLNQALGGSASIRLQDGRYRLLVVDAATYRGVRDRLLSVGESFNDPQWREGYILARLLRSAAPVRTEELALEMRLGRTTVVGDLAQVRSMLAPYNVAVEGKPRVGLHLVGPELGIRLAVLDHAFAAAYRDYPLGGQLDAALDDVLREHRMGAESTGVMRRWTTVTLDRHLTGHPLGELPASYRELIGTPAHALAVNLAARIQPLLGERLPDDEVVFLALPAAGMRTVADDDDIAPPSAADDLVSRILDKVSDEMDVRLAPSELIREFGQHLTFLVNRLRYALHLTREARPTALHEEYPAAHRMATIAGEVITDETGLIVTADELSLLTTYFQVFLEDHASRQRRELSVTIVSGRGPATARLVRSTLQTVLPGGTRYTIVPDSAPGDLDASDLVVTTPGARVETSRPTLELSEASDRQALVRKLQAMRIPTHGPLTSGAPAGSMLVSLLDEARFVRLPDGCDYAGGTRRLVRRLTRLGLVGVDFEAELTAREQRSTMQLDDQVGFPHATDATIVSPVCALGVVPRPDADAGVRLIFLMALPDKTTYDDSILIRVYDEIIRLGGNRAALARISRLTSYEQFFYVMENLATGPTS